MELSCKRRFCITALLLSAGFMTAMSTSVTGNMLPAIQMELSISPDEAQWLTSGAMLASGILLPLTSAGIRRISNRSYFLCATGIFGIGALLALFSPGFLLLMAGRLLQGAGCGMMLSFVQVILLTISPQNSHGRIMAGYAMSSTLASVVGPGYAGLVVDHFGWRGVFVTLVGLAGLLFLAGVLCLVNVTEKEHEKIHSLDALLSAAGCFLLLLGVDRGNLLILLLGIGLLIIFCRTQFHRKTPMLDLRVFSYPGFAIAAGMNLGMYLIAMGSAVLLPMLAQTLCGHSAAAYGLATVPGGILSAVTSFLAGHWFDRHSIKLPLVLGVALFTGYAVFGLGFSEAWGLPAFGAAFAIQSIALGILNPALSALALSGLDHRARTDGSALYTALRQIASALATTLSIALYSRWNAFSVFVFYGCVAFILGLFTIYFLHKKHETPPH